MGIFRTSRMTPEELVRALKNVDRPRIRSVILYGSAAAGDQVARQSDVNLMLVTDSLLPGDLRSLRACCRGWVRQGNPPPMLLTLDQLRDSCDVFPIEMLDLKESHRILMGEDVVTPLSVDLDDLRLQLERELKSRLIQLREGYLLADPKPKRVLGLVTGSLSSVLVLARAALRLFQADVPRRKPEALKTLAPHIGLNLAPFEQAMRLREGALSPRQVNAEDLFASYLEAVELLVTRVDTHIRRR